MTELPITERERKLLRRLAKGMSDRSIAISIGGREDQVRDQRVRLLAKLHIDTHADLVEAAERLAPWKPPGSKVAGRMSSRKVSASRANVSWRS